MRWIYIHPLSLSASSIGRLALELYFLRQFLKWSPKDMMISAIITFLTLRMPFYPVVNVPEYPSKKILLCASSLLFLPSFFFSLCILLIDGERMEKSPKDLCRRTDDVTVKVDKKWLHRTWLVVHVPAILHFIKQNNGRIRRVGWRILNRWTSEKPSGRPSTVSASNNQTMFGQIIGQNRSGF